MMKAEKKTESLLLTGVFRQKCLETPANIGVLRIVKRPPRRERD